MAIVAADLKAYASLNPAGDPPGPDDDTDASGGGIDSLYQVIFSGAQIDTGGGDDLEVVTDGAQGGTTITVVARHATGVLETSAAIVIANPGPTAITFPVGLDNDIVNIHSLTLSAAAAGGTTVTLRRVAGATVHVVPAGERGAIRLFRNASSDPVLGRTRYEKMFLKNDHATLSLLAASADQTADLSGKHAFALETSVDGTESLGNRLGTAPTNVTAFGTTAITLLAATTVADLASGSAIGLWVRQTLGIGDAPISDVQDRVEHQLSGNTAP